MKKLISIVNGVEISAVFENGETYVPVKPICEAIGIDAKAQRDKINEHPILNSVGVLSTSTGSDGKQYEMFCLPLKYVYGWLFTINPDNVAETSRKNVIKYHRECYDVLYEHFAGTLRRQVESNRAEIEALQAVNAAILREKEARVDRKKAEETLAKIREERLDPNPRLPL